MCDCGVCFSGWYFCICVCCVPLYDCGVFIVISERVFICEHNGNSGLESISCAGKPGTYLDIEFAHYGRTARGICVHPTLPSTYTGCTNGVGNPWMIVRRLCQGKASCRLQAHNSVFGDPCVGTTKYLEVEYMCRHSG